MKISLCSSRKAPRRFAYHAFILVLMVAFIGLSQTASAAGNYIFTGSGATALYTSTANWQRDSSPYVAPVNSSDVVIFAGGSPKTRAGIQETLLLDSSAPSTMIGGNNGLNSIKLTSSQTTSVILQSDTSFMPRSICIGSGAQTSSVVLEAGSGSLTFDGDTPNYIRIALGQNSLAASSTNTFINNNMPGGSVLKFGTGVIFGVRGGNTTTIRTQVFDGVGDIIFNGRILFYQGGSILIKKGSGMLTLGGDAADTSDYALLSIGTILKNNKIGLEAGILNINNAGVFGTADTFTISGGVLNNTSGNRVALKTDPRIVILGDFTFSGSNDLTLGAGQVDLTGSQRTITVAAGRLGLGGTITGTNTGIILNGSGTLALAGNSTSYTGTVTVPNGTFMADGGFDKSTITIGPGATLGGTGTVGNVTMGAGSTLRPGDLTLIVTDTTMMASGIFTGTIGARYSAMTIDKSASAVAAPLQWASGVKLEFALGKARTHTEVNITNSGAATTPTIVFDSNIIKITDLTGGTAQPGAYMLFRTSGTFTTDFQGLTYDGDNNITGGLSVEALPAYVQPNYAYRLKKTDNGIGFFLYGAPVITCNDPTVAVKDWGYQNNITMSDGVESSSAAGLPAGLSYNSTTYVISGTPTTAGFYTGTITATNPATTTTKTISIEVRAAIPAPVFTIDPVIVRPVAPFSCDITASNLPQLFTVISGMEPWMTFARDPITGIWSISGTPPAGGGSYTLTLQAENPSGPTQTTLTIIIADSSQAPDITSATSVLGVVGYPLSYHITATNSPAFYGISGTVPGAKLDALTGTFSGTATVAGSSTVTMHAINSSGTGSKPVRVEVLASMAQPSITSSATAIGSLNQGFSYTITGTPYITSLSVTGPLPGWLYYDSNTYTLSGTCQGDPSAWAASGSTWPIAVKAVNMVGTSTATISVHIKRVFPIPTITNSGTETCYEGKPYSGQITVTSTAGIDSYSALGLPTGLNIDAVTGVISGNPIPSGTYTINVAASTSGGTGTGSYILKVVPVSGPYITSPTTAAGTPGQPFSYQITADTPVKTYGAKGLPPGLSLDSATGLISGTTYASGRYMIEITTKDSIGTFAATVTLSLVPSNSTSLVTYAGALNTPGLVNAIGTDSRFNQPASAAIAISGTIYVADYTNNAIRAIAPDGTVSSYLTGVSKPAAIAVDSLGNIYFADQQNNTIEKILAVDKSVHTIASGLLSPGGVAIDSSDNVYFTDSGHNQIKRISAANGTISVVAGNGTVGAFNGPGNLAQFNSPEGLVYDKATNTLYVADKLNSTLRAVNLATNEVSRVAGLATQDGYLDGVGSTARFHTLEGVAVDAAGFIYVADTGNSTIRVCDPRTGLVSTLIGTPQHPGSVDGSGTTALMNLPKGIIVDSNGTGDIYIIDSGNSAIRTLLVPPCFVKPLVSGGISDGASITLDGSAWGAPTPMYLWYKNGVLITGTQGKTLFIDSASNSNAAATYQIVAYNATGTISSSMQLTVGLPGGGGTMVVHGEGLDDGGGGGASSLWFLLGLAGLVLYRQTVGRRTGK